MSAVGHDRIDAGAGGRARTSLAPEFRALAHRALWAGLVVAASLTSAWAGPQANVETLDGHKSSGELVQVDARQVVLKTADGPQQIPTANVLSIKPAQAAPGALLARPTCRVDLVDGGQLAALSYRVKDGVAHLELAGAGDMDIPTKQLHWVRFLADPRGDRLAREWSQIVAGKAAGDLIVVRKQGSLDYLEGVLGNVDDETVDFELDKEPVPVKRPKVEGLIYYHAKGDDLPEPIAEAIEQNGSRLPVRSIALDADRLTITTPAGLKVSRPLTALERLDFSSVNTQWLSALDPDTFQYTPYFTAKVELPVLAEAYRPRRDAAFDGSPLKLDGQTYAKGLALHARSEVAYRLPGKYRRFKAMLGIDDSVRPGGDVQLEIRGDKKLLWEGRVRGSEPAKPLDLDIAGVKRLEILVDFGADLDVGDVLDLGEARVTK